MKIKKSTIVKGWLPVLIWMGVIFWFSHQPGDVSGASSGRIVALITSGITTIFPFLEINVEMFHFLLRKGAHFGVYAVLGILSVRAFHISGYSRKQGILYGWILATFYAGTDEFHQTFIPGRSGELSDVLIDSAGALTGIAVYVLAKGIQVPARGGKNTLQYILMTEGREVEDNKEADDTKKEKDSRGGNELQEGSSRKAVSRLKENKRLIDGEE